MNTKEQYKQVEELAAALPETVVRPALAHAVMCIYLAANKRMPLPPADIPPDVSLMGLVRAMEEHGKTKPKPIDTKGKSLSTILDMLPHEIKNEMIFMMVSVMRDVSIGKRPVPPESDPEDIFMGFVETAVEACGGVVVELPPDTKFDPETFDPKASADILKEAIAKAKGG